MKYLIEDCKISTEKATDHGSRTLLSVAASWGNFELIKYLINEINLDPNETSGNYTTILIAASKNG